MKKMWALALACCLLVPGPAIAQEGGPQRADIHVQRVEGLSRDFIFGADVSSLLSLEKSGVTFKDETGDPAELVSLLSQNGFNYARVRVWNDPKRTRNSPTKPLVPGKPTEAMVNSRNRKA